MSASEMKLNLAKPGIDAEADAYRASRRRSLWRSRSLPALGILGIVAAWWAVVAIFDVKPFIAPTGPGAANAVRQARHPAAEPHADRGRGRRGFLLGNLLAALLATVFVHSKTLREIFYPVAGMINSIPIVAKAPILVLIMGNGIEPKITIAAMVCFFPTLVNMVRGLEDVNPQSLELMRVLSASKREIFFKLRLYNSLPYLFSALRRASMSVIGAVVGEWIGATAAWAP